MNHIVPGAQLFKGWLYIAAAGFIAGLYVG